MAIDEFLEKYTIVELERENRREELAAQRGGSPNGKMTNWKHPKTKIKRWYWLWKINSFKQ